VSSRVNSDRYSVVNEDTAERPFLSLLSGPEFVQAVVFRTTKRIHQHTDMAIQTDGGTIRWEHKHTKERELLVDSS